MPLAELKRSPSAWSVQRNKGQTQRRVRSQSCLAAQKQPLFGRENPRMSSKRRRLVNDLWQAHVSSTWAIGHTVSRKKRFTLSRAGPPARHLAAGHWAGFTRPELSILKTSHPFHPASVRQWIQTSVNVVVLFCLMRKLLCLVYWFQICDAPATMSLHRWVDCDTYSVQQLKTWQLVECEAEMKECSYM